MAFIKTYHFVWAIDGVQDETEFCAKNVDEAVELFDDFCHTEGITAEEVSVSLRYNADDAALYGKTYYPIEYYLDRVCDYTYQWDLKREEADDVEDAEYE